MQKLKIIDYRLPSWALPYLINSDPSGLEDSDIEKVDRFVAEQLANGCAQFHVTTPGGEKYFAYTNDIDNLGSDCYDCPVIVDVIEPGCPIQSIRVKAKRWFNSWEGNSYHNVKIWANGVKLVHLKNVYGYDKQYLETAARWLEDNKFITDRERHTNGCRERLALYCEDRKIEFTDNTNDNY